MKKKLFFLFIIVVVIVVIGSYFWVRSSFAPKSGQSNFQAFVIPKGAGASLIANKLEKEGFINSALAFRFYTQLTGISKRILAGEYKISPHMSLIQIVGELTRGPLEIWVTVPEGLRREEIAEKFVSGLEKTGDEADEFRQEFWQESKDKEGYLFPDTYLFPKEASASAVVSRMRTTFDKRLTEFEGQVSASPLNLKEIVTLASILERETVTDEERPIVAGILKNRIDIGMGLQADATVQYALASSKCKTPTADCEWWPRPLTREDITLDSPYNTYKYRGLPPGPIASPGISSLRAAINPATTDFLYYLHDPKGQVHYASTLEEHNANVSKYLGK